MAVGSVSTSLSLLERLCGGDEDAWRRFLTLYEPLLHAWLRQTPLQVLEAQRTFRAVQSEYANAVADHGQARAELEHATAAVPADLLFAAASETRRPR